MIIKGKARGRAAQLAWHLLRTDQNEEVRLVECRGTVASDVKGALKEIEAHAAGARCKRPLYHASLSPAAGRAMTPEQIRIAVDLLEAKLGLTMRPRIVVAHKKGGREHVHVVWSRVDTETHQVASDSWNYRVHEEVARELEMMFGHEPVTGSRRFSPGQTRRRTDAEYERRQAERSGVPAWRVSADLAEIWKGSRDGVEFSTRLELAGYRLARGDRRAFVVIDQAGEVHSLSRRLRGIPGKEICARLADVPLDQLPSVSAVRSSSAIRKPRVKAIRRAFRTAEREIVAACVPAVRFSRGTLEPTPIPVTASRRRLTGESRSQWAIVMTEFGARIAAALQNRPAGEQEAVLEALRLERSAALRRLETEAREERPMPIGPSPTRRRRRFQIRAKRFAELRPSGSPRVPE